MGLFTQKPEFDDELPGLPGEPLRAESAAERLSDAPFIDVGLVGLIGEGGGAIESIVIPVVPVIEMVEVQESTEGDGED